MDSESEVLAIDCRDITACYALIQSIAAARQRTPIKDEAVFS
jgi:hypothetical protein